MRKENLATTEGPVIKRENTFAQRYVLLKSEF